MTTDHSVYNATIVAARFEEWGPDVWVVIGRIFEDRANRFEDGLLVHTSYILEQHELSEGEWLVRTKNSVYHVFVTGYRGAAGMPTEVSEN